MRTPTTAESTAADQHEIIVPITQPLHFTPHRGDIQITEPVVDIKDVVVLDERPEATVIACLQTNHGLVEALIRVPRETFNDGKLITRRQAHLDGSALIYGRTPTITM